MKSFLYFFLLVISPILSNSQKTDVLLKKADSLITAGKYKEALTIYTNILKSDPKNKKALQERGYLYFDLEKYDEAEKDLKEVLKTDPSCSNCLVSLGYISYYLKNDSAAGYSLIEKAIQADPKNTHAYVIKAHVLDWKQKYKEAEALLGTAITLDSNYIEAYYYRALLYVDNNEPEKAKQDFLSIIMIDPHQAPVYFELGLIFTNEDNYDSALKNFLLAIKEDSTESSYYKNVGNTYFYKSIWDSSLKYYSKAISLDPGDYECYFFRSQVWQRLANYDASCTDLNTAFKGFPKDDDRAINADAEGFLKKVCDSSSASYYYMRGLAKSSLHQYDQALKFYEKGLIKFPRHAMMINFRGNAHSALGNYKDAEADYTQGLSLQNNLLAEIKQSWAHYKKDVVQQELVVSNFLSEMHYNRARVRIGLGEYDSAGADIEEVLRIPASATALDETYFISGILSIIVENNSAALNSFNRSIAINANYADAYVHRAVAKLSLAFKTKVAFYYWNNLGRSLDIHVTFKFPKVAKSSINIDNLEAAITDCNKAIQIYKDYADAYFIRASIKMLLDQDYCNDLLKAEQLGLTEATNMINEKKCR